MVLSRYADGRCSGVGLRPLRKGPESGGRNNGFGSTGCGRIGLSGARFGGLRESLCMVCFGMPAAPLGRFGFADFAEGSESDERTAVSIRRGYGRIGSEGKPYTIMLECAPAKPYFVPRSLSLRRGRANPARNENRYGK